MEFPPESYQSIGWLLVALAALAFLANQILKLIDRSKENPRPSLTYATIKEHERLEHRVDEISEEIKVGFERMEGRRSESVAHIYDEMRKIAEKVHVGSEQSRTATSSVGVLSGKIDHLIEKVGELKGRGS